ncbi:hypothetical protein B296_00005215 [Ensete ventricosum]|uniref:Uncharacterized protein n=1 Tax=Ensete ventricosum TaxID=4639 RepID=A0A427BAP6_ENSVE|nr:hypothetical protein B296_00005215 [Ensete ventricosum]
MFNLGKIKSSGSASSGSTTPSTTSASSTLGFVVITAEKRPDTNEGVNLRKRNKGVAPELLVGVVGSTTKAPAKKGKELVEIEELPERGYSNRNLCEVEDRAGANGYFASIMMRLSLGESEEPLTSSALVDRVHDADRLVRYKHKRILALRAANKELKLAADQEVIATVEHQVNELQATMDWLWVELESSKSWRKSLE